MLLQRVSEASVTVAAEVLGEIGSGFVALVGVAPGDTAAESAALARKTATLRVFEDAHGRMNLAVADVAGAVLVVSQFTLYADTSRGNRPGFTAAAPPEDAAPLVTHYADTLAGLGVPVAHGRFGAHMQVRLTNDGPVTILLERGPG